MSTYSDSLGLEEITPGDQAGLWGNTTNNNLALIDQAVTGVTPLSFAGVGGTTQTLVATNGAVDTARSAVLNITGTATSANTVVIPNKQKTYLVRNNTSQDILFTTASPSATYTVGASNSILIFCDGNNGVFTGIAAPGSGTLGVVGGGTGATGFGAGGFIVSAGGTSALAALAAIGIGGTVGGSPVPAQVLGQLQPVNGGTGQSSLPSGAVLIGNGTNGVSAVSAAATNGYVLTTNGSAWSAQAPGAGILTANNSWSGTNAFSQTPTGAGAYTMLTTNTGGQLSGTNSWSGANSFNNTGGTGTPIYGATTSSTAASGYVGELLTVSSAIPVSLVSGSLATLTTLAIGAGDWDIWGWMTTSNDQFTSCLFGINSSAALGASNATYIAGGGTIGPCAGQAPLLPFRSASSFTIYLLINTTFTSGSPTASGTIYARRVR
jgi:hypothetical protein